MRSGPDKPFLAWGRLLRISLLPTALADGIAGFALAGLAGGPTPLQLLLFISSAGIYHGAMALNDWADFQEDSELRPDRPLPKGFVGRNEALFAGCGLILLGVATAAYLNLSLGAWMAVIAAVAFAYNVWLRGPLTGPLCLGICRGMHLGAPIALVAPNHLLENAPILIGYGLYVFALSSLARIETRPSEQLNKTPRAILVCIATAFACPLIYAAWDINTSRLVAVSALALLGAGALIKTSIGGGSWTPARVQTAVGIGLRLLLVYTASAALTGAQPYAWTGAALILAGYPAAHGLRKLFPPT